MLTKRIVLLALCATLVLLWSPLPSLSDDEDRVAGSYLAIGQFEGSPPPPTIQFLLTINDDGTVQVSPTDHFSSLAHGAWEKTGYLEIAGTNFNFAFDPTTGALVAINQVDFSQRCNDKDCDIIEGRFSIAVFACDVVCPNPQDLPPLVPIFQASVTYTGQRIIPPAGIEDDDDDDDDDDD